MAIICRNCGNQKAFQVRTIYIKGGAHDECDRCGVVHIGLGAADVYYPGEPYHDECIGDPKTSPAGSWITSKRHKAQMLRDLGLREAGDRRHGAR